MTEKEASTKLCPWMTQSMTSSLNGSPYCATRFCMAWQPIETAIFQNTAESEFRRNGKRLKSGGVPHGKYTLGDVT